MALADSVSSSFVKLAVWATGRAVRGKSPGRALAWAAVCGIALTGAVLTKISNLIFLCMPVLAALTLFARRRSRAVGYAGSAYVACMANLGPIALLVIIVGRSDLGFDRVAALTAGQTDHVTRLLGVLDMLGQHIHAYFPFPLWLVYGVGLVVALLQPNRAAWFVGSTLIVTVGILLARLLPVYTESRYLAAYAPLLTLLAGFGIVRLTSRLRTRWILLGLGLAIAPGVIFVIQSWAQPERLHSPRHDAEQHVVSWSSGYGFRELAHDLLARHEPAHLLLVDDLGGQQRLEAYLLGQTDLITIQQYSSGTPPAGSMFVIDSPKYDSQVAALGLSLVEVSRYPRPGGETAIVVYSVGP